MTLLDQIITETTNANANATGTDTETANATDTDVPQRLTDQRKLVVEKHGIVMREPVFTLGTRVRQDPGTQDRIARVRQGFDDLPLVGDAMDSLISEIEREQRRDVLSRLGELSLDPETGRVHHARGKGTGLMLSANAYSQLMQLTESPDSAARYHLSERTPLGVRAAEFNRIMTENASKEVYVRLRKPVGSDEYAAFAFVSQRYDRETSIDTVAKQLKDRRDLRDARAEVEYSAGSTTIRLHAASDVAGSDYRAGEVFRAVAAFRIADDKSAGGNFWREVHRNLCLNLIIVDVAKSANIRGRHVGRSMTDWLNTALDSASGFLPDFLEMWDAARATEIENPREALKVLTLGNGLEIDLPRELKKPVIKAPKTSPLDAFDIMRNAWEKEPDPTLAGLSNAVTRAAHENTWGNYQVTDFLQQIGSDLLVWNDRQVEQLNRATRQL
jgi:hypothetical protein